MNDWQYLHHPAGSWSVAHVRDFNRQNASILIIRGRDSESMVSASLQRQTLADQLYGILETRILTGELVPGTHLSEEALATSFGVSRAPVREALTELDRSGFTARLTSRDRVVMIPTAELIRQKYDLWWIVDAGRTYLASMDASPADCTELRELVSHMADAVTRGDVPDYRRHSNAFHSKIRTLCRNGPVNDVADRCDLYLRWFEMIYEWMPEASAEAVCEHTVIMDAFEARDCALLTENIRVHMLRQREHIVSLFETAHLASQTSIRPDAATASLARG